MYGDLEGDPGSERTPNGPPIDTDIVPRLSFQHSTARYATGYARVMSHRRGNLRDGGLWAWRYNEFLRYGMKRCWMLRGLVSVADAPSVRVGSYAGLG